MFDQLKKQKKLAFIVGGSGLIGSEVINLLLRNKKMKVINLDIVQRKEKIKNITNNEFFYRFDCRDKNLKNKTTKLIKKFGTPDIFINCAYPKTRDWKRNSFKEIQIKSLEENIKFNLVSSSYLAKLIAEANVKVKKKCSIVFLSSIYGLVGQDISIYKNTSIKENMTYSIIKGGLINLTKQMASYYSKYNIRINNVCPGGVLDKTKIKSRKYKNFIKNYSSRCPIKRLADPKEIAQPIIFLSSEDSSYITGTSLIVDGGWTAI